MKPTFRAFLPLTLCFFLSASLLLTSCDEDKSNPTNNNNNNTSGSVYLTFKVNGVAKDYAQYNPFGYYYANNNGSYIDGREGGFTHPDFNLGFPGKTTGTFTEANGGWLDYTDENDVDYALTSSTCTITVTQYGAVDGYIVGTFSAVKYSPSNLTATVTEGKFSVKRTY
jgi:hypothetical protein